MHRIPQSAAIRVPLQGFLASDHVSPATGLTIAVTISKNGAAYGNPSAGATNATEIANGSYYVDLSTTDTGTVGPLFVRGAVATMDPITIIYDVAVLVVTLDLTQALPSTPTVNSVGEALFIADNTVGRINTAQAGAASTITLDSGASSTDGRYVGYGVYLYGGTGGGIRGVGQERTITAYNGTTKVATVAQAWGTNPDNTSKFMLYVQPWTNVGMWNGTAVTAPNTAGTPVVDVTKWLGGTIPAVNVTGVPLIDLKYTLGTISPATAGSVRADAVTGAVGSVTGAVGSVTGNVGGNVVGTVASVVGAVGSVTGLTASNLDVAVSTRLAASSYTAPDNADIVAIKAKTDNLPASPANETLIIAATDAIIAAIADKTGYRLSATGVNDILRTALTEGYAADGATMTVEQVLHMIWAMLNTKAIVSTTLTTRKLDKTTAAMTHTLDSGSAPTSQTRAT